MKKVDIYNKFADMVEIKAEKKGIILLDIDLDQIVRHLLCLFVSGKNVEKELNRVFRSF